MDEMERLIKEAEAVVARAETRRIEDALSQSMTVKTTPEVDFLLAQAKEVEKMVCHYEALIRGASVRPICPICQEGWLNSSLRGKKFLFLSDRWFVCDQCSAEFQETFSGLSLIKSSHDPFSVARNHDGKTLPLKQWAKIALDRISVIKFECEERLSGMKDKLGEYVSQLFFEGRFKVLIGSLDGFLFKAGEKPLLAIPAALIEERKRRVTKRTTTGGTERSYGGFSFRVATGVYYHAGSSASSSPRRTTIESSEYTELVEADDGVFLITNQRLIFKGGRSRGLVVPLGKIAALDVDTDEDALLIVQENKKPVILKVVTSLKADIGGTEVPITLDLDGIVTVVRRALSTGGK